MFWLAWGKHQAMANAWDRGNALAHGSVYASSPFPTGLIYTLPVREKNIQKKKTFFDSTQFV